MKIIIAGGRDFEDYNQLAEYCDYILSNISPVEIVSGHAKGADLLGERYAERKGYNMTWFPADWNLHGKKAGILRNIEMADYADALIAFWDGKSKGTRHMIDTAREKGLNVRVRLY